MGSMAFSPRLPSYDSHQLLARRPGGPNPNLRESIDPPISNNLILVQLSLQYSFLIALIS
jgi:hypothetical protein